MVHLSSEIKSAFLSSIFLEAQKSGTPLADALNCFLLSQFEACRTGRLVVSHAGAGKSTVFQNPRVDQQFRQEEVLGLAQQFLKIYKTAVSLLDHPPAPTDTSQDALLYNFMLDDDDLADISRTLPDFTELLWPNR